MCQNMCQNENFSLPKWHMFWHTLWNMLTQVPHTPDTWWHIPTQIGLAHAKAHTFWHILTKNKRIKELRLNMNCCVDIVLGLLPSLPLWLLYCNTHLKFRIHFFNLNNDNRNWKEVEANKQSRQKATAATSHSHCRSSNSLPLARGCWSSSTRGF